MKKKENQRITLTKRLLRESLLQLMEKKQIQHITVVELCEAAGINRSTFYHHYGCPAELLKEIEISVIDELKLTYETEAAGKNWSPSKRIEALCTYFQEHRKLAKLLFRDSATDSDFANLLFQAARIQGTFDRILSHERNPDRRKLIITFLTNGTY
ncbi:MAG: TetR/AcrR family transcriptional regulator, partial [Lachnospiraceae bacterium]